MPAKTKKTTTKSLKPNRTKATKSAPKPAKARKTTKPKVKQPEITEVFPEPAKNSNPLDYLLRLDVLIALALFFLLVATVVSFTVIRRDLAQTRQAVTRLEQAVYR